MLQKISDDFEQVASLAPIDRTFKVVMMNAAQRKACKRVGLARTCVARNIGGNTKDLRQVQILECGKHEESFHFTTPTANSSSLDTSIIIIIIITSLVISLTNDHHNPTQVLLNRSASFKHNRGVPSS